VLRRRRGFSLAFRLPATVFNPLRGNRITLRDYHKDIYKERNLVERLFQKLKQYRRVATR
jgi:transposase